jgi:hypothetical protein
MPYIIVGDPTSWKSQIYDKDLGYNYPNNLDLRPNSDFHKDLRTKIWQRANEARMVIQKRFDSWREIDRTLTTYIPVSDLKELEETELQGKEPDKPISIVFPYSYSTLEALLTYMSMAFFQDPLFHYEGVEDDDTVGAMLMEMVVRLHCIKSKVPLNLHTMFRDSLSYGIGAAIPGWRQVRGKRAVRNPSASQSPLGTMDTSNVSFIDDILYEGNDLSNIDPYMWLPDPSVSSADIQKGEFVGWVDRTNYMSLLTEESQLDSGMFNVKYLKDKTNRRSTLALDQSDREVKFGGPDDMSVAMSQTTNPLDIIKMYITLIPKDWKLSGSEIPEKWYFALASDDVIIRCEKADHNHGMYPVAVASPEFDGYSITPIGRMEVLYGLQHTLDFLFNSHITNVRKAINDMLIVDPYLVNIQDPKDPKPGKLIRLRRPAWGRGVDKVVQQLAVQDITRLNISDASYITQLMDRISGADSSMQGALRTTGPERLTGAEFQGTRGSAVSRLQRLAMIIGMQFMQDVGTMFAVHTQQYMKKETYVKIVGNYAEKLSQIFAKTGQALPTDKIRATPYDLAINYDLIVRDGSIPGGNFSSAWIDLFKTITAQPELAQQFDVTKIFMYIAHQLGAKNVEDFRRNINQVNTVTMPDAKVMSEVSKGNMVPTSTITQ